MFKKKSENTVALGMVLLKSPTLPTPSMLEKFFVDNFEGVNVKAKVDSKGDHGVHAIDIDFGKEKGIGVLMPVPVPWPDLEGPCLTAWWWPEATSTLKTHTAHVVVSLLNRADDVIQNHLNVTRLVAAFAATTESVGVYWGAGTLVRSCEDFIASARNSSRANLPLELWVDFRLLRNPDNRWQVITTGMESFNVPELEVGPVNIEPEELLNFTAGVADYVIASNEEIREGHTIGRSETERWTIHRRKSVLDRPGLVLHIDVA